MRRPGFRGYRRPIDAPRGTSAPPFSPLDIAGCFLWLVSTAGVVLGTGADVDDWQDQSPAGNDFAAVVGAEPQFVAAGFGSLPTVRFVATSFHRMTNATLQNTLSGNGTPHTVLCAVQLNSTGTFQTLFSAEGASAQIEYRPDASGVHGMRRRNDFFVTTTVNTVEASDTSPHAHTSLYTGAAATIRIDGAATSVTGTPMVTGATTTNTLTTLGARNGPANFLNADLSEVIMYDSALGTTDRDAVENYLIGKYGL